MTYEVSAAAKPPQTTPLYIGVRAETRERNGEHRRRRASGRCAHSDRQNGKIDSRIGNAAQQRGSGDTRRSLPARRHECLYKGGLSAAVLPPPTLRTSLLARHSRRFTTETSLSFYWRPKSSALAREAYSGIGLLPGECLRKRLTGRVSVPFGVVGKHAFDNADRVYEF
jgi:hypothetical protein